MAEYQTQAEKNRECKNERKREKMEIRKRATKGSGEEGRRRKREIGRQERDRETGERQRDRRETGRQVSGGKTGHDLQTESKLLESC